MTVEIDESMFGKRKVLLIYFWVNTHIMFSTIEEEFLEDDKCGFWGECAERREFYEWDAIIYKAISRKEIFLVVCPNNKRDKATLLKIINEKVSKYVVVIIFYDLRLLKRR